MTAAYDDDTISSRRQENVKSSDVPVDFNDREKIVGSDAAGNRDELAVSEKSYSDGNEDGGGTMSEEDFQQQDAGQSTKKDALFLKPNTEAVCKTADNSVTDRCNSLDSVVNKDGENCVNDAASDSRLVPAKQKNNDEEEIIVTETEEHFSRMDLRNAAAFVCGTAIQERENKKFNQNDIHRVADDDKSSSVVEPAKLATISAGAAVKTTKNNLEIKMSNRDKNKNKDFNCNLTDENKISDELGMTTMAYRESEGLIEPEEEDETSSSVDSTNPRQKGSLKNIPIENRRRDSESAIIRSIDSIDQKIAPLKITGRSKTDASIHHPEVWTSGDMYDVKNGNRPEYSSEELDLEEFYDPECEISFHEAVRTGDAKSVEMLIARGAVQNIDEPDWNVSGDPPLLVAATNHSLPVLRVLLANGCDPGVRSPRGETALHRAILNGSPSSVYEMVEELLKYGCPSTVKEAGGGLTALHVQTRQLVHAQSSKSLQHNFDIALKTLELLAKVGPVDAKDHQGRSALHLLASSSTFGNSHRIEIEPMIRTLLDAGADPALKNDRGETPLHEALERGALNTGFLLIPYTPIGITSRYGETPLHIAARKNQYEVVDNLLKRGEDPGFQDAGGNTPLHLASARGFHQTVSLLVTSPLAQLEKTNDEGLTSLQVAAESGFVNAVKLLLKAGADPSQSANYCITTLHRHPDISVLINHELTRRRQLAA